MYINEHNILTQTDIRTNELRREAVAHRLAHEARHTGQKPARRRLNVAAIVRHIVPMLKQPTLERSLPGPVAHRV